MNHADLYSYNCHSEWTVHTHNDDGLYTVRTYIKDWSLTTGRGGGQNGRGVCEVLPLRKGGLENVSAMLKGLGGGGRHKKFWGSFYMVA